MSPLIEHGLIAVPHSSDLSEVLGQVFSHVPHETLKTCRCVVHKYYLY